MYSGAIRLAALCSILLCNTSCVIRSASSNRFVPLDKKQLHVSSSKLAQKKYFSRKPYWHNHYLDDIDYSVSTGVKSSGMVNLSARGSKVKVSNRATEYISNTSRGSRRSLALDRTIDRLSRRKYVFRGNGIVFESTNFHTLNGWQHDNFDHALESFLSSCKAFQIYARNNRNVRSANLVFGNIKDWLQVCRVAVAHYELNQSKIFFERHFVPFIVHGKENRTATRTGLFTGYLEFSIKGSRKRTSKYRYGIYQRPPECRKKRVCYTRDEINHGRIDDRKLDLYWVSDYIDLINLQTQGSGIIDLEDEQTYERVVFGGDNGRAPKRFWDFFYRVLPKKHAGCNITVRRWLKDHPRIALKAFGFNPSYTFFAKFHNKSGSVVGAQNVPLTPSRSVAVDPRFIPYGMPLWLETKLPVIDNNTTDWMRFHRLAIAQDTGGAIKGPIRADIFFGHGNKAHFLADRMRFTGTYYALIPKVVLNKVTRV